VKNCSIPARALSFPIFLLLLGCVGISILSAATSAQSLLTDDVKHDTPGQVIRPGQAIHIRTTMNIYTQAIPRAVREANRRVVRSIMGKKAALRRQ
jgi:hypothetical protein